MLYHVTLDLDRNKSPKYLLECVDKLEEEQKSTGIELDTSCIFKLDEHFERVFFSLDELSMQIDNLKVWAMMKAYYGFEIEYDSRIKEFKIGGYETDLITSKTVHGLLRKMEVIFNKTWRGE